MTQAYRGWMASMTTELPDIREVFLDSAMSEMSFTARPGLDGYGLLVAMCQQCHNANLDPSISRDRFLVDRLDMMSREEKELAVARLTTVKTSRLTMPPPLFHSVTDPERLKMIDELRR
jgi:hypothetical protein